MKCGSGCMAGPVAKALLIQQLAERRAGASSCFPPFIKIYAVYSEAIPETIRYCLGLCDGIRLSGDARKSSRRKFARIYCDFKRKVDLEHIVTTPKVGSEDPFGDGVGREVLGKHKRERA